MGACLFETPRPFKVGAGLQYGRFGVLKSGVSNAASQCFGAQCGGVVYGTAGRQPGTSGGPKTGTLDIYFIDVEGGAANLLVTPEGESLLIDSGYPDNQGRDLNRIVKVAKDVAGLSRIDHAMVSHWHLDHFGNHAALAAQFGIGTFWDRGIPDSLSEDPGFPDRIAAYRAASQNQSQAARRPASTCR